MLYSSSLTHSTLDSPFPIKVSSPLPEVALLSKSKTDDINSSTYPLLEHLQPPSSSPCVMTNGRILLPSPPGLSNIAIPGVAPLLLVNVDDTRISDSSDTSLPPIVPLSSPSALALPSQLLSPMWSYPSPYQTLPQVHAILSLSQSSPSPLSRTNSPFEFTGLSPRLGMVNRSTLLSAESGVSREQSSASPVDSTRSTTYVSFSSPALSASCISSENGYENDFSPSDISSTFSSPFVAPTRLVGLESLSLHNEARLGLSLPLLSSGSTPPFDVNHFPRERNVGWTPTRTSVSYFPAVTTRSHESDARCSIISFNDNISDDYADTRTLRTRSPSTRTMTESVATTSTSTEIHLLESAARLSRVTTRESDFGTASELSDLDFLSMSTEE